MPSPNHRGYFAACTLGIPDPLTIAAVERDVARWARGDASATEYTAIVERARAHAATLLGVTADRIAVGSQVSVFAGLAAASAPPGAEIVCALGDFSSVVGPFVARRDLCVRHVPLDAVADAISDSTWMVAVSVVQSATGEIADTSAISTAARATGALVLFDTTQATGWMPTTDLDADLIVCHAYKWLCAPRGAAFAAASARAIAELTPFTAGWYSGDDPWASCYGPESHLAGGASRFDVSPAWHAWAGAEVALRLAAERDADDVRRHDLSLANAFRARLDLEPAGSAIVTWPDPDQAHLDALRAAGVTASGRAGRARVAFHLWNDEGDVDLAAAAITRRMATRS